MDQNFSSTKLPTSGVNSGPGYPPNASWSNPSRITADDGSSATIGFFEGGQNGDLLVASGFDFQQLPDSAVIDGIEVFVDGSNTGCYGSVILTGITGVSSKDLGTLNTTYGSSTDLWGAASIDPSELASIGVTIDANDVSGGDGSASVDYLSITVYWHIEVANAAADVPTRFAYKVYSRDGNYLGELPNVTSKFAFSQDINSAGSSITVVCGEFVKNEVTVSPLLTEAGDPITTEDDREIVATQTDLRVTTGNSVDEAIYKNSNRVKVWMYNKYYPNGKLMFSGQINRVEFKYGGGDATVKLLIFSDGLDLSNYIARGYPFSYTTDVTQNSQNGYVTVQQYSFGGWERYGQTWLSGGGANNIGALVLKLQGNATVTLSFYDGPNGNFIGSITKAVNNGSAADVQFEAAQLIGISPSTEYFVGVSVASGQSIRVYRHSTSSTYADGSMYNSSYSGGSGGGSWGAVSGDFYFITKYGTPTTTTTYSSDDPVTDMASGILQDYNDRGGYITERDFEATGLSLTYTFVVATILDALKKILELCPTGYYSYIDLGTAEIDIKQMSTTPDYTVVRGRHINELNLALSIEQVKNYLLLSGGDTGGGTNLYRDYPDAESVSNYGIRTATKSDNRITLAATADAIGETFIEENADEVQETQLVVKGEHIDLTLLTPGKTIGFKNFGNFIDDMVLQIVRREPNFSDDIAVFTLGRLPVRMNDEVQRINRDLLNQQTIDNPSAPS